MCNKSNRRGKGTFNLSSFDLSNIFFHLAKAFRHLNGYRKTNCHLDNDEAGRRTFEALCARRYDETRYTIRYFQPDGKGELRMDDARCSCPTTATRSKGRYSGSTTPPPRRISRPSTSTSKTTSGNTPNCLSTSTTRTKKKRRCRI